MTKKRPTPRGLAADQRIRQNIADMRKFCAILARNDEAERAAIKAANQSIRRHLDDATGLDCARPGGVMYRLLNHNQGRQS